MIPNSSPDQLSDAERCCLLQSWQNPQSAPPFEGSLFMQCAAWSLVMPESTALCLERPDGLLDLMSYGLLLEKVQALALALKLQGVRDESRVAVLCVQDSYWVISLLALHSLGAVFCPLDPLLAPLRLKAMIKALSPALLLHDDCDVSAFNLPKLLASTPSNLPVSELPPPAAQQLALVCFNPSGQAVMLNHAALTTSCHELVSLLEISPDDGLLLDACNSDLAVVEVYCALSSGASLFCRHAKTRKLPPFDFWNSHEITHAFITSTQLTRLEGDSSIRTLVISGDDPLPADVKRLASQCRLFNCYGPVESSFMTTSVLLNPVQEVVPIGFARAGVALYVLDASMQLVPAGNSGDLFIGGLGLGRGYLNKPALTAASFLPNPFSDCPGDRLFRSGDRVRFLIQGSLPAHAPALALDAARVPCPMPHRLVEACARDRGADTALLYGEHSLCFAELDQAANRMAHSLAALGVEPGDTVALLAIDHDLVARDMLACLKLGAAFMCPDLLDPQLNALLQEAQPAALVIYADALKSAANAVVVATTTGCALLAGEVLSGGLAEMASPLLQVDDPISRDVPDSSPAYIAFTSGSTGSPKGIVLTRASLAQFVGFFMAQWQLAPGLRVAQWARHRFDAAYYETLAALAAGATLCMAPPEARRQPEAALIWLRSSEITLFKTVPGFCRELATIMEPTANLPHLQCLLLAGEALPPSLVAAWSRLAPQLRLFNLYGPTETILCTLHGVVAEDASRDSVPIGSALAGRQTLLLNEKNEPALQGEKAALFIVSPFLSSGYLKRPAETAARFLPNPFSQEAGSRMYHSGDLALAHADGNLRFQGRSDNQIKLRGQRIELEAIEAILERAMPNMQAALALRANEQGESYLLAFVSPKSLDSEALAAFARKHLPAYQVPHLFHPMDALPRTANGKLLRRSLPQVELHSSTSFEEPQTPEETTIAAIFAEVLNCERVGALDDFFQLGGHSLLAARALARLQAAFESPLVLTDLFNHPTARSLATKVTPNASNKTKLKLFPREQRPPLSFGQQRLWFVDQLDGASDVYNISMAVEMIGDLDLAALRLSLAALIDRHEALRTCFPIEKGVPYQKVHQSLPLPLQVCDVAEHDLQTALDQTARHSFQLARGPLLHFRLLKHTNNVLVMVMHHIISDAWSMDLMIREFAALYRGHHLGKPVALQPLPLQYADFATAQIRGLGGDGLEKLQHYWRARLQGVPTRHKLPKDHKPDVASAGQAAEVQFTIEPSIAEQLKQLGLAQGATLFMVLHAALALVLARSGNHWDSVVGTSTANRFDLRLEKLVGFFVNTLPLRLTIKPDHSFKQLLAQAIKHDLEALDHAALPFEQIVEQSRSDNARNGLVQIIFMLQNAETISLDLPDLTLRQVPLNKGKARFDLALTLSDSRAGTLQGLLVYDSTLFEASTMLALCNRYSVLLSAIATGMDRPVALLPLMDDAERLRLLALGQGPQPDQTFCPVHYQVSAQARRNGQALALVDTETSLSFAQLEVRSNQLASLLRQRGIGPTSLLALCLERKNHYVIALLAALKTGAAYLPLNADDPSARRIKMLEDAQAALNLCEVATAHEYVPSFIYPDLDADLEATFQVSPCPPQAAAFAIYTSGSTGQPKASITTHGAIANTVAAEVGGFSFTNGDQALHLHNFAFDAASFVLFKALCYGATLHIASLKQILDPSRLGAYVRQARIDGFSCTPSMLAQWQVQDFASVTRISSGGEALSPELVEVWRGRGLINQYGPSEAAVIATSAALKSGQAINIGKAIDHASVVILDEWGQLAPAGVPGELCIGGRGLSPGYLFKPALSAQQFTPHPLVSGQRLYHSGDRARLLADGSFAYLGRLDHQVKLRGYRIELGEVESALQKLVHVAEAAAVLATFDSEPLLVAYLVAEPGAELEPPAQMNRALQQRLPRFMVPELYVRLPKLPLNATDKVDRNSLAKALPAKATVLENRSDKMPATPMEEALADLWLELLPVQSLGSESDFFELGGHSLLATRLAAHIEAKLGVSLSVADIFEHPRLSEQALFVAHGTASEENTIPAQERELDVNGNFSLPSSFAQKRLYFLHAFSGGSSAYHIPSHMRLEGALDVAALETALQQTFARHEALRTRFVEQQGKLHQQVHATVNFRLTLVQQPGGGVAQLAHRLTERPFNLQVDTLVRITCVRVKPKEHLLLVNLHHIITDGWSSNLLMTEIGTVYNALLVGGQVKQSPLRLHYADFTAWQNSLLVGETLATDLAFWREALADAPALLELPTWQPRAQVSTAAAGRQSFELGGGLSRDMDAFAKEQGATPYMLFQALLAVLLGRHAQQETVVLGSPVANRTHADLEPIIGFFVNTLAMCTSFADDPTCQQLLARVRTQSLEAFAHQQLPFEKLVESLQLPKAVDHSPLFQVLLVIQNLEASGVNLTGLEATPLAVGMTQTAKFDLTFTFIRAEHGYLGAVEYNADLYDQTLIQHLLERLTRLAQNALAQPKLPMSRQPLSTESSRRVLLERWGPQTSNDNVSPLHQQVESWVARRPQAIALQYPEQEPVTYGELNGSANALAAQLLKRGVQPEELVGVFAARSTALVVGLLAVLKAGAAYLPLDVAYPAERVAFMLADAHTRLVLSDEESAKHLPSEVEVLALQAQPAQAENPNLAVSSQQLAYAIYTSGTSGQPKAVLISHGHVARLFKASAQYLTFSRSDCWSFYHSHAFDVSVWEIWGALCHGARLLVVPYLLSREPQAFYRLLAEQEVTVLSQTPTAFRQLITHSEEIDLALRLVLFAGEALDPSMLQSWYKHHGDERPLLANLYGITEVCIHASWQALTSAHAQHQSAPLGQPFSHLGLYVMDKHLEPLDIFLPGELYVAGRAPARGYLQRPALTAERFIPDPYSAEAGGRLYRSGDCARLLGDGSLHYLGRADQQVQLRGFRIETGEVEANCVRFATVESAVVLPRRASLGAWLLAPAELDLAGLRRFLHQSLPAYMVPSHYFILEQWPLTTNGKLDRGALLAMEPSVAQVAPRQGLEGPAALLASLWSALLEVDQIGMDDDFFKLGGHSLLATQLVTRIRETFAVELSLRTLFDAPSLAAQTEAIAAAKHQHRPERPALVPIARDQRLPLSFAQTRIWFLQRLEGPSSSYNIPAALRMRGKLEPAVLERCFHQLYRRHESLRSGFTEQDGAPSLTVQAEIKPSLHVEQVPGVSGQAREQAMQQIVAAEMGTPFDLTRPPLLRCRLLRIEPEEHVLLMVAHHIIADGWSVSVMVRELSILYRSIAAGQPSPLEPLPVQVVDVTHWQQQWLKGEQLEEQLAYWSRTLAGLPVLALPYDSPRPARPTHAGAGLTFCIEPGLSRRLHRFGQAQGVSLFMTLLAAFQWLLGSFAQQRDFGVGTPIANRNIKETEGLIGLFMNALVMRAQLDGKLSFCGLLRQVRQTCLEAYAHQEVPFEQLAEALQPDRNLSLPLWYQVMLVLQNTPDQTLKLGDLELEQLSGEISKAKLDLTLYLTETTAGIVGNLEYSTELFESGSVKLLMRHYKNLLRHLLTQPELELERLALTDEAERRTLQELSLGRQQDFGGDQLIHQLFEAQERRDPTAIAVTESTGASLDYGTLNRYANHLARKLRSQGLRPEDRVGIYTDSGPQRVVAVLAVLKAGGAFVPLDLIYPEARLAHMFEDSGARYLLCQPGLEGKLASPSTLVLDKHSGEGTDPGNLQPNTSSHSLAYVIYSSGSTGKPKGIALSQQAWSNAYEAWRLEYELTASDRHLQMASFSFDVCAGDLARALCSGASLVLCPREALIQPEQLYAILTEQRITVAEFVPAVMRALLEYLEQNKQRLPHLRILIVGSDLWNMAEYTKLEGYLSEATRLLNTYGVTEAAIDSSYYGRAAQAPANEGSVPIGQPFANTQMLVLDEQLALCGQGWPGILYLGGPNLARGYYGDPARTAQKFVPHPLSEAAGARLYRTDDKVRYLFTETGASPLVFLGRVDEQVKLRGLRIELGEVEVAFEELATVQRAVVAVKGSGNGAMLVAYLVLQAGEGPPDSVAVRETLTRHLPDYMIPGALVVLEELPLTPNGKIDRKLLPEPDRGAVTQERVAAKTPLEAQIAAIWCQVLELEEVGVTHNFFDLGGHSLLATRVIARLSRELERSIPLRLMFEEPTITAFAERLELIQWAAEMEDESDTGLLEEEGSL